MTRNGRKTAIYQSQILVISLYFLWLQQQMCKKGLLSSSARRRNWRQANTTVIGSSQNRSGDGGSIDSPSSRSNPVKSDQIQSTIVSDYRQNSRTSPSKEQNSKLVKELVETQQRRSSSPQKSSSPSKESPTRSLAHSGGVAKSDLNIVSLVLFNR